MQNTDEKKWETLIYELFESLFSQIMPGSVVVFLYLPQLTDQATKIPSLITTFEFFLTAWIIGIVINILGYSIPTGFVSMPNLAHLDVQTVRERARQAVKQMLRNLVYISIFTICLPPLNCLWPKNRAFGLVCVVILFVTWACLKHQEISKMPKK